MFVGNGIRQRAAAGGLGLYQPTPTGIAVKSIPTCASPEEKAEAAAKCRTISLHGLGQAATQVLGPMTGRLAGYSPCDVQNFPVCPTPKCIDEKTVGIIVQCMNGMSVDGVDCNDPKTAFYLYALSMLPYCQRPSVLTPVPACVEAAVKTQLTYCGQYPKFNGPNKVMNTTCWLATHDPAYWKTLSSAPICQHPAPPQVMRQPAPPAPPPTVMRPPPAAPPRVQAPPPVMRPPEPPPPMHDTEIIPPEDVPEQGPEHRESSMMGLWGILALVAATGGGYYLYRKYKK